MKNNYTQSIWHGLKALMIVLMMIFSSSSIFAQTITINDFSTAPYYTYGDFEVDYEANDYPAGTTFYIVVDTNGNGFLDAEDDSEDYIVVSSTDETDVISGDLPNMTGSFDFYVVAGEDGTLGEVIDESSVAGTSMVVSGSDESDLPYSFDLATTARTASTPTLDLTSDDYYIIVIDVDATNVTATNPLVFEYSTDAGASFDPLTDQQGDDEFSDFSGELVFAISQSINVEDVEFRLSQDNGETLAASTEDWTLNSVDIIEYSGTFVQYNEEYIGSLTINAPTFTINDETYDTYIGEDIEVDYEALGFTSGATFYLYTGDLYDSEDRTIFDTNESVSGILSGTWPLEIGGDNVDVRIAGIYGNVDDSEIDFENDDLNITGSSSTDFNYYFGDAGIRSASTDELDLSGEEYITLEVQVYTPSNLSSDNALLVQYSTDGSTWIDMEDEDGLDEIDGNVFNTYNYPVPDEATTSSTRFRIRQKSIDLTSGNQYWYLYNMDLNFYIEGADQFLSSPFVTNYSITVSSIEDEDDANITGGSAYPGDEITVTAAVDGFDVDDYNEDYTVLINNSFLLDNLDVSIDGVTDDIIITGNIPTDVEYVSAADIQVKIFEGDEPLVTLNQDIFNDYNIEEDITVEGAEVEEGDTDVDFFMAGDRSLTTPEFEISSVDELTLEFTLSRTNAVRSPSGTEVVLEYSTDGSTFTEIETYSLNSAGEAGETYELDDTTLPTGMASPNTSIRFRQASNNGLDLDAWNLLGIVITGGTNILDPGYIDYNEVSLDILSPEIILTEIDNANLDIYPSSELDITFELVGELPAGTTFELILERELDGSISFGDFTDEGDYTVTVPAVAEETYDIFIASSHEEVESNTVELVITEVSIENISITSTDAVQDGEDLIVYAGNDIDISYEVVGEVGSGAVINLEIYDNETDEYMFIVEDEAIDGTISTTLPIGIDYDGNDADFRFTITNGNLSTFDISIDENWGTDQEAADEFFPVDLREGVYSSGFNYFLYNDGYRSATSIPLDFTNGGRVDIDLFTSWYDSDEDIYLEYSLDEGDTWENFETGTLTGNSTDVFSSFVDIPEEAWTDNVLIRFINSVDYTSSSLANGLRLTGFQVENYSLVPVSEEEFSLQPDLILEELSVSMSTFEETDFILGEEFVVEYNAEGPFADDVEFAIVLEQSGEYYTLAESDETGSVQVTVTIPSFPFEDPDDPYDLEVIPFVKEGENDVFRAAAETETISEEEDILAIEGRATTSTGSSGYSDFEFEKAGDRSLLTRAFDLEDFGSATLDFDFTWYDGDFTTLLTLPELQVSVDAGATFETIEVTDATYAEEGLIYPSGSYSVEIPEEYLTAATHFKWVQALNLGENEDVWRIYNIDVVKGETNELNDAIYTTFNNPQSINVTVPSLDNYIWEQSDLTDAVFNGEDFEYNWNFDEDALEESNFPEETEYVFYIDVEDPETGEYLIIGETSSLGDNFIASIPSYVENGTYDVMLTASITVEEDGEEEVYYIFEEESVASLDVFLKAVETVYLGDENAVIYAGQTVTFGVEIDNDESTTTDFSTFTSNLIVNYDGDDWLLAAQTGIEDITVDLPPFVQDSDVEFRIELSEDGAIGDVGEILEEGSIGNLEDDADNFISGDVDTFDDVSFENNSGRGLVTTRDFEAGELDNTVLFEFDIYFDELPEDLTDDQNIIFEYSTDGGETYTELASFPEDDAEEILNSETFSFDVTSDMIANDTRLRWRQEEIKGTFYVSQIGFTFDEVLPFDYIPTEIDIDQQALLITSIDSDDACMEDDIVINYEIRGRFGEDNIVDVRYRYESGTNNDIDGYEFNLTEGTGSVTIQMPSSVLDDNDDNENFDFRLEAYDATNEDYDFSVNGSYSETTVEVVALLDGDSESFSKSSGNTLTCEGEDVILSINSPRDYFLYEIMDEDGIILGSLTYDPENPESQINLGVLTESVVLEMMVTSFSSKGLECNSVISSSTVEIEILENAELYVYNYEDSSPEYVLVESGDSKTICEGSSSQVLLRLLRPNGDFITSGIEWFRDDFNTPISTSSLINNSTLSEAGSYFARVTDGSCVYTSESYIIENIALPEIPEITVTGDFGTCEGDGDEEVTLEATAGYTYYSWSNGETTQSITVESTGTYYVSVSNVPFSEGCSVTSESVELEVNPSQEFTVYSDQTDDFIVDGDEINDCDEYSRITFYDEDQDGILYATSSVSSGIYVIYKDGVEYANTTSYYIDLDESGEYYVEWMDDALNAVCMTTSPTFTLNLSEELEIPEITVTGDFGTCEGDGDEEVTLEATADYTYYSWSNGETTQSITVESTGTYYVSVSNVPFSEGCSVTSESVELEVNPSQEFTVYSNETGEFIADADEINDCDEYSRITFYDEDQDGILYATSSVSSGIYTVYKDGVEYATTTSYYIDLDESGEYYVEWMDDALNAVCMTTSPTFTLNLTGLLDIPELTVTGSLGICDGDAGEVVLSTVLDYEYYEWSNGETTSSITVDEADDYYVEVSNFPLSLGCSSTSEITTLESSFSQEFTLFSDSQNNFLLGGETINDCDETTIRFYDDEYDNLQTANGGIYTIYQGTVEFGTTTSSSFIIDESGEYMVEWSNDVLNGNCTTSSVTFNVNITESIEDAPTISSTGSLLFCEGDGSVVLTVSETFNYYLWSGTGLEGTIGTQSITVTEGGNYTVQGSNVPFGEGCESPSSAPVIIEEVNLPEFTAQVYDGSYTDATEADEFEICDETTIRFLEDGTATNTGFVTVFRDGSEYAVTESSSFSVTESGSYSLEWSNDDERLTCTASVGAFDITIIEQPTETPILASSGDLVFCEGEGEVVLTAPVGFTTYLWSLNGTVINNATDGFDDSSNTRTVSQDGEYTVQVSNGQGTSCLSEISNSIELIVRSLPTIPDFDQSASTCGDGSIEFTVESSYLSGNYTYQLVNRMTGETSGDAVAGEPNQEVILNSASISEPTEFYLLVSYTDGSGCEAFDENDYITAYPDNVTIELIGNTIEATVTEWSTGYELNWYRNGTLLRNKVGAGSIIVTDAAEYSVVVDFDNGCSVTSNSVDLQTTPAEPETSGRLSVNTSVFPNPVSGTFSLEVLGTDFGMHDVSIMSMTGQVMFSAEFDKQEEEFSETISTETLKPGLYRMYISKGGKSHSLTLVVNE